jgi:hypothetical protein
MIKINFVTFLQNINIFAILSKMFKCGFKNWTPHKVTKVSPDLGLGVNNNKTCFKTWC